MKLLLLLSAALFAEPETCARKSVITDVESPGRPDCVSIHHNKGGTLDVYNWCKDDLVLPGYTIKASTLSPLAVVELYRDEKGEVKARRAGPAVYEPAAQEKLTAQGRVGRKKFTLAYLKSPRPCDDVTARK